MNIPKPRYIIRTDGDNLLCIGAKTGVEHVFTEAVQRVEEFTILRIPNLGCTIRTGGHDQSAAWVELGRQHITLMPFQCVKPFAIACTPDAGRFVLMSRDDELSIRAEGGI